MTRKEWDDMADEREKQRQAAAEEGDEVMAEYWRAKVHTARYNAAYGSEPAPAPDEEE